ncbi:MAG TPA: type 2 isopentenyl-diphosphate Delta-isomerase [Polyangiales bacterium]|jgi:isopentenyl-diphosphate delta-isomerase
MTDIRQRKADHLALCATDEVAFRSRTTLLECVEFLHDSLPELALSELDMSVQLFGKRLRAPLLIAAMTGGTEEAGEVNHTLAKIAERRGYAFGLGSQRAMQRAPETAWTYDVRKVAPQVLLLGNVGVVQAREQSSQTLDKLVHDIGADALCVHMNPAMEVIQPEGDDDFRGGLETFARVKRDLSVPIIAKETGNGISPRTAHRLREVGVGYIDVSGAGGTSWVGVETLRAEGAARDVGQLFWDWGVPTAASVVYAKRAGHEVIATGGIRTGLDVARAVALGAKIAGIARPVLQAFKEGGEAGAERFLARVERELATVLLLTGSRSLANLERAPRILRGELNDWLALQA